MVSEEFLQQIFSEVEFRIKSNIEPGKATFSDIKQTFVQVLQDLQFIILPQQISISSEFITDFQRIVSQNVAQDIDESDVYGEQLLKQLLHEGWLVVKKS
ncbi:MAG: hypothetical protein M0R03_12805 [Novosphingobium sp.]|nr:hypothetical protein [Novosphingobium sp.]